MKNKIKYYITGKRSVIAKSLRKNIPEEWIESEKDCDFLFITNKNKINIKAKHKIDLTSHSKVRELKDFSYGFELIDQVSNNISNPGCSAIGILYALYPIKEYLNNVDIYSYFPLNALKYNSPNRERAMKEGEFLLRREHYHKKEVEKVLGYSINYKTIITNKPEGLLVKLYLDTSVSKEELVEMLELFYKDNNKIKINDELILSDSDIKINLKAENEKIIIYTLLDNINFLAKNAIEQGKRLSCF